MERTYGIDRAAKHAGSDAHLARLIGVAPATVKRWRKDSPETALQKVVKAAGTQVALAGLLDVAQTTVSLWQRADIPPVDNAEPKNGVERAVRAAGSQSALARRLGVRQAAVSLWVKQGHVPAARAQEIEMQYGVPRTDLISPKLRNAMGTGGEL